MADYIVKNVGIVSVFMLTEDEVKEAEKEFLSRLVRIAGNGAEYTALELN